MKTHGFNMQILSWTWTHVSYPQREGKTMEAVQMSQPPNLLEQAGLLEFLFSTKNWACEFAVQGKAEKNIRHIYARNNLRKPHVCADTLSLGLPSSVMREKVYLLQKAWVRACICRCLSLSLASYSLSFSNSPSCLAPICAGVVLKRCYRLSTCLACEFQSSKDLETMLVHFSNDFPSHFHL